MAKKRYKAFTIVELLVAMTLLVILLGLSVMVFNTTVQAHRAAGATIEVSRKLRAVTDQLNTDFRGFRKDGEIFLVWGTGPAINEKGFMIDDNGDSIPDDYQKFDRIIFFADGDFQTCREQSLTTAAGSKIIHGNLARISYMLAKDSSGNKAANQPNRRKRILARTEHIVTSDTDLKPFPDWSAAWDPAAFETGNFYTYEYQTTTMADWTNMSLLPPGDPLFGAKNEILTILSDVQSILDTCTLNGGPTVEIGKTDTYRNLFCGGVGEFGIQIWLEDEQRWFPQIDPDGDGDYTDTDYLLDGSVIHSTAVGGVIYPGTDESDLETNSNMRIANRPLTFSAFKFTFTLYDSKGIFPDGKTFTHIVYIDN